MAMAINRYEEVEAIGTNLDPLTDLITWLEYYSAVDYVVSLLTERHGVASPSAMARAQLVRPHARLAREYIEQALSGPSDVAFLSIYYAILNLLKICILFGPRHALLPQNRWHGATYDGFQKDSQTLLTEKITVKKSGAIPLFYETITGRAVKKNTPLSLAEIYPYLLDVSAEFGMATGNPPKLAQLTFAVATTAEHKRLQVRVSVRKNTPLPRLNQLKALVGFEKDPSGRPGLFISKPIEGTHPAQIQPHLRRCLLYQNISEADPYCRISGSHFVFPEEFPIALAFFHLSSVVRYKPEFLARLKDSKYWPVVSTARRHCLLKFLITFWSFTHKKTIFINPG